jgi:hypothetical protein
MTIYNHIPYTYLIGWSHREKYYYGVRYAKGCNPNELWKTYFTSSKVVNKYRKLYGEPDIIQIRKLFTSKDKAILWENRVLEKLNVKSRLDFLNQTNNKAIVLDENHYDTMFSVEVRQKMSNSRKSYIENNRDLVETQLKAMRTKINYSCEKRNSKISKALKGKPKRKESVLKQRETLIKNGKVAGKNNPMFGRSAIKENNLKWYTNGVNDIMVEENTQPKGYVLGRKATGNKNKGQKRSEETKHKMSEAAKTPEKIIKSKMKLMWNNSRVCCIKCKRDCNNTWFKRKHNDCFTDF